MPVVEALQVFATRIRMLQRANADVPETGLAPAFQQLIETLLPLLPAAPVLTVVPEFRNPGVGRPDIALIRAGAPARAFIELKAPDRPGDPARWRGRDKNQFIRFGELPCWGVSNFSEFRLFERDTEMGFANVVPARALRPDTPDASADRLIAECDPNPFLMLLSRLCATDAPAARDAAHLAELLAHSAKLVRGIVQDRLAELHAAGNEQAALLQVRREFRDVLYAHPEAAGYNASDFDKLFSAAFAQTLAFGLLLVREGTGRPVGDDAWRHMPDEHPLMQTALRVLSLDEVVQDIGIGFTVMRDTVNSFAPEILAVRADGRDPILYFYEDFLETFDPAARERYGVYYTPIEVVRYMTGALDRALRDNLGTQGLQDPNVTILDPATGTGTFLLGIAERVRNQVEAAEGRIEARMALRDLAGRMYGFELLVGPYAVAHYRLHHALRARREGDEGQPLELPRLGVYLTDTLAQPGAAAPAGPLGFVSEGIADERHAADEVKAREPILAIIGNPPYKRLGEGENETLIGRWMDDLWDDLKRPVREAGQGNQLNTFPEFSIAFWRWALWKLFEAENAPRRGVIAFITNRKFLTGWPYAGLRKMMRERFDRIEVIDLRGDVRAGPRGGVANDQGVFNIMVGTAITLAIADGSKDEGELAEIRYFDSWSDDLFSRRAKLAWLDGQYAGDAPAGVFVDRGALDDMRPLPFIEMQWVSLTLCFSASSLGVQSKRDHFVYATRKVDLERRIVRFRAADAELATEMFSPTTARPIAAAQVTNFEDHSLVLACYRPLDRRFLYNVHAVLDRPRPQLQALWGTENSALYALPRGTGAGPAVWQHSNLPDYHSFRGSYGGYAFLLYDRRLGPEATNLNPTLIEGLSLAYGQAVTPPDVFDAILCLLSATSYTTRFAEDLEDTFPHVAFPADHAVFARAVAIGRDIREIEAFARQPEVPQGLCALASEPSGAVANGVTAHYADGAITLCADGSGRITGIPEAVWRFSVSGYRVLPRWIEGREGLLADLAFVRELRDVAARIVALIHSFDEADLVLADTLADSLSRDDLGLGNAAPPQDEDA
jgi:Type ISP C-terminal specificity domain/N-6 DNA Methylase